MIINLNTKDMNLQELETNIDELKRLYLDEQFTLKALTAHFCTHESYISILIKKYKLNRGRIKFQINPNINNDFFFKIDKEEKAYFLGYLMADGYNREEIKSIRFKLNEQDAEILRTFNKCIFKEYRDFNRQKQITKTGKVSNLICTSFTSKQISEDLASLGCVQNKTFFVKYPEIDKEFDRHFIRGYFDGDGCVNIHQSKKRHSQTIKVSLAGTYNLFLEIKKILNNIGIDCKIYKKGNIYSLEIKKEEDVYKFRDFIYNDSNEEFCLKRKKEKFYIPLKKLETKFTEEGLKSLRKKASIRTKGAGNPRAKKVKVILLSGEEKYYDCLKYFTDDYLLNYHSVKNYANKGIPYKNFKITYI